MNTLDLTTRPPRSPRVRLGGYAMLARVLDKARALLVGKVGDYKYNNPMDQHFLAFTGISAEALLEQAKKGAGDWALLVWVNENASPKRAPHEIRAWSARGPRGSKRCLSARPRIWSGSRRKRSVSTPRAPTSRPSWTISTPTTA